MLPCATVSWLVLLCAVIRAGVQVLVCVRSVQWVLTVSQELDAVIPVGLSNSGIHTSIV